MTAVVKLFNIVVKTISKSVLLFSCKQKPTLFEKVDVKQTGISFSNRIIENEDKIKLLKKELDLHRDESYSLIKESD